MGNPTIESLTKEIHRRLDAIEGTITTKGDVERLSQEHVAAIVRRLLKVELTQYRDLRLAGTKYGRLWVTLGDLEWLHDVLDSAQRTGRSSGPSQDLRNLIAGESDREALSETTARHRDEQQIEEMAGRGKLRGTALRSARSSLEQVYGRAMDTGESGYGAQLVGAAYVGELWRGARAASKVFSQIGSFEMRGPTEYLPVEGAPPEMLFVAENMASNSAEYPTQKTASQRVQVDAKKFLIHQIWSGEMEEDALLPFVAFLRDQAARSLAYHTDSLALNGDTTNAATGNVNLDDADPADTKHYLAFDGIRHAALVDNTGNSIDVAGPVTYDRLLRDVRGAMIDASRLHDWGHPNDPNDLIYVADPESCDQIAMLDEVITLDKFGPGATVLTGQQAQIGRHPLVSSLAVSKTEADGKVSTTAGNNTKGQVAAFNRAGFVIGWRRQVKIEVERLAARDQSRLVYSMRLGFGRYSSTGAASGIEAAVVLRDITL